jgi:hypothetical protein
LDVDVGETEFEEHAGFDGAVLFELRDDLVVKGHMVGLELAGLQESGKV